MPYINSDETTSLSENEVPVKKPKIDQDESCIDVTPPPLDSQILIDKTACWACKEIIKDGNDHAVEEKLGLLKDSDKEKFEFLFPKSKYHNYFKFKLALYKEMLSTEDKQDKIRQIQDNSDSNNSQNTAYEETNAAKNEKTKETKCKKFPSLKGFFNA